MIFAMAASFESPFNEPELTSFPSPAVAMPVSFGSPSSLETTT